MITLTKEKFDQLGSPIGSGSMGDAYWSHDKNLVYYFLRNRNDVKLLERINYFVYEFTKELKERTFYDFVKQKFNLPIDLIQYENKIGLVLKPHPQEFYFLKGFLEEKEKSLKWFCHEKIRNKYLLSKGNLYSYYQAIKQISSIVSIFNELNIFFYDLSSHEILFNENNGNIRFISWDSIGRNKIDNIGISPSPGYIDPYLLSQGKDFINRPTRESNQYALAVLIYKILFHREPLRGSMVHDVNDEKRDEELLMGSKAIFIENPYDKSNQVKTSNLTSFELPYGNPQLRPYTLSGKYFKQLFDRAFIEGLHNPNKRPKPIEWVYAANMTMDLLIPCLNPECEEKFFVYNNEMHPVCPYCKTPVKNSYPILNFYSKDINNYISDNHRMIATENKKILSRHINNDNSITQKTLSEELLAMFRKENQKWYLINKKLQGLFSLDSHKIIVPDAKIELKEGMKLLLDYPSNSRLIIVQILNPD